jgi:co-chaperonin GroES (HSP10)
MNFEPINRHLVLEEALADENDKDKTTILVPDDYSAPKSPHKVYEVLAASKDCEKISSDVVGNSVLVDDSMVEKIEHNGQTLYLLLENYVYGVFTEEQNNAA